MVSVLDPNAFKNDHQKVCFITSTQMLTEVEQDEDEINQEILTTLLQYFESVKKEKFSILESSLGVLVDLYVPEDDEEEEGADKSQSLEQVL